MNSKKFESLISHSRFSRYLIATNNDSKKAQNLYLANLRVAQSLHPLVGLLEIIIRNKINQVLTNHFNDTHWIINEVNGFMLHPSLTKIDYTTGRTVQDQWLRSEVNRARTRLIQANKTVTVGKIIAEQSFGFWTQLFDTKYYRLLAGRPIQIFSGLPTNYGRREIANDLNSVRRLRNRINHNEPICFDKIVIWISRQF